MCKLRSEAPLDQGDDGLGGEVEEGGIYETIETVVVQVNTIETHKSVKAKLLLLLIYVSSFDSFRKSYIFL